MTHAGGVAAVFMMDHACSYGALDCGLGSPRPCLNNLVLHKLISLVGRWLKLV